MLLKIYYSLLSQAGGVMRRIRASADAAFRADGAIQTTEARGMRSDIRARWLARGQPGNDTASITGQERTAFNACSEMNETASAVSGASFAGRIGVIGSMITIAFQYVSGVGKGGMFRADGAMQTAEIRSAIGGSGSKPAAKATAGTAASKAAGGADAVTLAADGTANAGAGKSAAGKSAVSLVSGAVLGYVEALNESGYANTLAAAIASLDGGGAHFAQGIAALTLAAAGALEWVSAVVAVGDAKFGTSAEAAMTSATNAAAGETKTVLSAQSGMMLAQQGDGQTAVTIAASGGPSLATVSDIRASQETTSLGVRGLVALGTALASIVTTTFAVLGALSVGTNYQARSNAGAVLSAKGTVGTAQAAGSEPAQTVAVIGTLTPATVAQAAGSEYSVIGATGTLTVISWIYPVYNDGDLYIRQAKTITASGSNLSIT